MRSLFLSVFLLLPITLFAKDTYTDSALGITFPKTIQEFNYMKKDSYGDPRLGYSLTYWNEKRILATIYVYDFGITDIKDGTEGVHVKQEIRNASKDIRRAVKAGQYKSAKKRKISKHFSPQFLKVGYTLKINDGTKRRSFLLLRGKNKHFIKIRVTGWNDDETEHEIIKFVDGLSQIIVNNDIPISQEQ